MKKSLISAVKKLLAKLGAEEVEGNNLVEVIDSGADALANAGGSNAPLICTDNNGTLDKTMGEIQAASLAGRTIIIVIDSIRFTTVAFMPVHIEKSEYTGDIRYFNLSGTLLIYAVTELTEEAALAAYPIRL